MAWMTPGGYCSLLLADMGAEVIILEQPEGGDPTRNIPWYFESLHRNKKSITINVGSEKGKEICYKLAQWADVVIEGFRPGTAKRLGIDYDSFSKVNPKLIYASISGWGQDGPYSGRPGHDLSYMGAAGLLSNQMNEDNVMRPPVPIADLSSAMFATIGILSALYYRGNAEKGQYVDVSMTDGLVSWMGLPLTKYLNSGDEAPRLYDPAYDTFQTKDSNKPISLSIAFEDHFWRNLCNIINKKEWSNLTREERLSRRDELNNGLQEVFLAKSRDEWLQSLDAANVPSGPVYSVSEMCTDPHFQQRNMFAEAGKPQDEKMRLVSSPLKFSKTPVEIKTGPPCLGEHTEEILASLGYTRQQIDTMRREEVI